MCLSIESCSGVLQVGLRRLAALRPILKQYLLLHNKAVTDLALSHCTLCKMLSILLSTFTTLVAKVRVL